MSLYQQNEIQISPAFQRFFRWSDDQKSKLIESILLGIPIPPIFVAQRKDGIWEVIDGLQRLSTIYEFAGILKGKDGNLLPPLRLSKTKYLPALKDKFWESENEEHSLTTTQRILIKRAKIGVSILLIEADNRGKYELFQRLNTGGSSLSDQEVRNAIMVMMNEAIFNKVLELSEYPSFKLCTALSDNSLEERYDMELVLRFIFLYNAPEDVFTGFKDLNVFLDDILIDRLEEKEFNIDEVEAVFKATFDFLEEEMGDHSLKKYVPGKDTFQGGFVVRAFEVIALGIAYNIGCLDQLRGTVRKRAVRLWTQEERLPGTSGVRANTRIAQTIPLGREYFNCG